METEREAVFRAPYLDTYTQIVTPSPPPEITPSSIVSTHCVVLHSKSTDENGVYSALQQVRLVRDVPFWGSKSPVSHSLPSICLSLRNKYTYLQQ